MPSLNRIGGRGPAYGGAPGVRQTRRAILGAAAALGLFATRAGARAQPRRLKLLCLGDSLTAGYLLPAGQGFVPVLEKTLRARGLDVEAIDAGVSGDTATGGLDRLDWALGEGADVAIVELGANDMFRGIDPKVTFAALDAIVAKLKENGVRPVVAGMKASRGMGADFTAAFDAIYPALARKYDAPLYPFFLEGVAGDPKLNLPDGIHPTREGVEKIVAGVAPLVEAELRKVGR